MFNFLRPKKGGGKTHQPPDQNSVGAAERQPRLLVPFYFKECHFIAQKELTPRKDGDAFILDKKMTNYMELPFEPAEQGDAENGVWMRDVRNGQSVLHFSESIPTFDSGDRIYDSAARWYFMCENGHISVLNIHHGYQLGSVKIYQNILAENDAAKALIRQMNKQDKKGI